MTACAASALGFRVKSGYAIAVLLDGPARTPHAAARHVVSLSDPDDDETRQPYHSGRGEAEEDARKIARRIRAIERVASRSIASLPALADRRCPRATLVVGSVIDPATVGNPHIRAHASEGRLFRTVLEDALRARGIRCAVVVEKRLAEEAPRRLGRTAADIGRMLASFGKSLGAPWRSEEKSAAVGAWMALD